MLLKLACEWPNLFSAQIDIEQGGIQLVLAGKLQAGRQIKRWADCLDFQVHKQIINVVSEYGVVLDNENAFPG
nr:hypothetical protein [Qipengyuania marisflavi]